MSQAQTHHKLAPDGGVLSASGVGGKESRPAIALEQLAAILTGCVPETCRAAGAAETGVICPY